MFKRGRGNKKQIQSEPVDCDIGFDAHKLNLTAEEFPLKCNFICSKGVVKVKKAELIVIKCEEG